MSFEIRLTQKLGQSLFMTPQLQQAIKLLQLGRTEFLELLETEVLENPFLEDLRDQSFQSPEEDTTDSKEESLKDPNNSNEDFAQNYYDREGDLSLHVTGSTSKRSDYDDELYSLEATVSQPEGLTTHLAWQLRTTDLDEREKEIAVQIIGNLDVNGYLSVSLGELAEDCNATEAEVERVLLVVQTLDPIGVASRDLRECLLIQLEQLGLGNSLASLIVDKHLHDLEFRRYEAIAEEAGVPVEDVYDALKEIQKLEPRPGRPFADEATVFITPDLYVRKQGGEWVVTLNEAGFPKLKLSNPYKELFSRKNKNRNEQEKLYLQDRMRSATWLIRSIEQRHQTILKVANSIMQFQQDFLEQGVVGLRPLVLKDVAMDVEMHESTISRVTTNKYIHTPHGIFELKFFFRAGVRSDSGELSSESIKEHIRALVQGEDPKNPLSDQALVEALKKEGIDVARRTIAKYREMMGILASARRKKVF